ncbi:hypothetical protein AB0P36_32205 [Streptomyces flavidovirens]|uniref:hypothetical protein n=1 Tax=Streptomyces flavidovirens TaxID=67298 RepID=UPI0034498AC2
MTAKPSRETWARSLETEPSVTVTEETFFGHGWQPLTLATLQAIWFLPATAEFSVEQLVAWFGALGWKSANGKPLGEDAVRRELALIRKAGYVRAYRVKGEGGRMAGMRYEVSKRQMEPQERIGVLSGKSAKPQVAPCASNEGTWSLPGMDKTENHRSHHVPPLTTHGDPPYMADQAKPQVAPCASNGGSPPTPPLWEEDYSSSQKPSSVTPDIPAAAVTAAAEFLAELPGRWACGRRSAQELAPLLAEAVVAQGWVLGEALVQQLTSCRIPPRKLPAQVLAEQIEDLPRYRAAARKAPAPAHRHGRERPGPVRIPEQQLALEDGEHTRAADTVAAVPGEQLRQARELLGTLTGPWALGSV